MRKNLTIKNVKMTQSPSKDEFKKVELIRLDEISEILKYSNYEKEKAMYELYGIEIWRRY